MKTVLLQSVLKNNNEVSISPKCNKTEKKTVLL